MPDNSKIIANVVEQHAENAAFLWLLRDAAIKEPHYKLKDLIKLDDRVEANIDGLRIGAEPAWEICHQALEMQEAGEVFCAGVLALESRQGKRLDAVMEVANLNEKNFRAIVSASGWLQFSTLDDWLPGLLNANHISYKRLALAACQVQGIDPGNQLFDFCNTNDLYLQCRALRMAGVFKRKDMIPVLKDSVRSDEPLLRFWAAWSATVMKQSFAYSILEDFVQQDSPFTQRALQLLLRVWDRRFAQPWLKQLASDPAMRRWVIMGTGVAGDPLIIPWLLEQMTTDYHARIAGEAFSMITGVDIAYDDLDRDEPEDFAMGPSEDPEDEDVALDADEDLPWPNADLIGAWWQQNRSRFAVGRRYLCGEEITQSQCHHVLQNGFQRQRQAAALELALINQDNLLINTSAPGYRQKTQKLLHEARQIDLEPIS